MGQYANSELTKGMVRDTTASKTPPNVVDFMLNGVYDNREGGIGSVHTEGGCEIPPLSIMRINGTSYFYIGYVDITPNKKIIFLTDDNGQDALAYFTQGKVELIREFHGTESFGFSTSYPIRGIGRIRKGHEHTVYWCDGTNPDRFLIVNRLDLYQTTGVFDLNLTLFNRQFTTPSVEMTSSISAGGLFELGAYRIAFQYIDSLGNTTDVFYVSKEFYAGQGNDTNAPYFITGGYNRLSENWAEADDAYNPVNKSYVFELDNLDPKYETLRIYALKYVDGNQTLTSTHIVEEINLNSRTSLTWDFTGIDANSTTVPNSDVTVSNTRYETSQAMSHIQNYLIKGNVTEAPYDWAKFQRYAQTAEVKWCVKDVGIDDNINNSSGGLGGFINTSFYRNEVACLGYTVILTSGQESPIFNIIGRRKIGGPTDSLTIGGIDYNNAYYQGYVDPDMRNVIGVNDEWDDQLLTVVGDYADPTAPVFPVLPDITANNQNQINLANGRHLGLAITDTVERWKIYNTSIHDTPATTINGCVASGIPGYYEVDTRYPDIRDGDGELVYPYTIINGIEVMDKIRHHRMPTTAMCPLATLDNEIVYNVPLNETDEDHIFPLGVSITNITIPPEYADQVAGIKLYSGTRDQDKTVYDKGVYISQGGRWYGLCPPFAPVSSTVQYHSADFDLNGSQYGKANFMRTESTIKIKSAQWVDVARAFPDFQRIAGFENIGVSQYKKGNPLSVEVQNVNRNLDGYISGSFNDGRFYDYSQKELTINTDVLKWSDPTITITGSTITQTGQILPGQSKTAPSTLMYCGLMNSRDVFDNVKSILYKPLNDKIYDVDDIPVVLGDDCFINRNWLQTTVIDDEVVITTLKKRTAAMWSYFTECAFNYDFRHEGTGDKEQFYSDWPTTNQIVPFVNLSDNAPWHDVSGTAIEEYHGFNTDYGKMIHPSTKGTWNHELDYSSPDLGRFPVRLIWSGKSQDEEIGDRNLVFAALDFDDLSSDKGEIRMMTQKPNMIYIMTDYSVFYKPTNTQSIELSGAIAALKQSSFLDIAETEMFETGTGYGGCQHRFAFVDTEFGTVYVNQYKGEVYLLNKGLESLEAKGLSWRLRDILPSKFLREFEEQMDYQYPLYDATTNQDLGLGVRCLYDPIYKRAIITKIDYEFLIPFAGEYPGATLSDSTVLYWSTELSTFIWDNASVNLEDRRFFQRRHLTLSYDFRGQKWASFHSWIPIAGLSDTQNMYTLPRGDDSWRRHVPHNYLQYYDDTRFPFMVEWITPNMERATINQINWMTRCGEWDDTYNKYKPIKEETFNQMIVYSDYNTTGLLNLVNTQNDPFAWVNLSIDTRPIKRHNQVWRVNNLWDIRSEDASIEPAMTENLTDANYIDTWYQGLTGGYVDHVPNTAAYDFNLSHFHIAPIDNEYISCRLIYDNQNLNRKLSLDLVSLFKQQDLL